MAPLYAAVAAGKAGTVRRLLEAGADADEPEPESGWRPLHMAAYLGREDITGMLLKHGHGSADPNAADSRGWRPAHIASQEGHAAVLRLLLSHGGQADAATCNGTTPLHVAAQEGKAGAVRVLLLFKASVDAQTQAGHTPLHCAAARSRAEVVSILLAAGAPLAAADQSGCQALHRAAACWKAQRAAQGAATVAALVAAGADPSANNQAGKTAGEVASERGVGQPFAAAVLEGQWAWLASLRKRGEAGMDAYESSSDDESDDGGYNGGSTVSNRGGGDPGAGPDTPKPADKLRPVSSTATRPSPPSSPPPPAPRREPSLAELGEALLLASAAGDTAAVGRLLRVAAARGAGAASQVAAHKDSNGHTALHVAAAHGHCQVLAQLLSSGASLAAFSSNGETPLHAAVAAGQVDAVAALTARLGDIDLRDAAGSSPLHLAATRGQVAAARALLAGGVSPDAVDAADGNTALHLAAATGRLATVAALVNGGANPDVKNKSMVTPVMLAANGGHVMVVRSLLRASADAHLRDGAGNSALHHAVMGWRAEAADAFKAIGEELLMAGCDLGAINKEGHTALALAMQLGATEVEKLLTDASGATFIETLVESTRPKNTPGFWAAALCNHPYLLPRITEKDAELLQHLSQVDYVFGRHGERAHCFVFLFASNPFLRSRKLVKQYPVEEDAAQIKGTVLDWMPGKELVPGPVSATRPGTPLQQGESFFAWFRVPQVPLKGELSLQEQQALQEDCAIAAAINDVLQRAPDWRSGAAVRDYRPHNQCLEAGFNFQASVLISELLSSIKPTQVALPGGPAAAALVAGRSAAQEKRYGTAYDQLTLAIKLVSSSTTGIQVEALLARSAVLLEMGKGKDARKDAQQVRQLRADDPRGAAAEGLALMLTRDFKDAKKCFKVARNLSPDYPDIYEMLQNARQQISARWDRRFDNVRTCVGPMIGLAMSVFGL